jgi:Ser/Thr protein kinase RdoA (MazF antagonist)
LNIKHLNILRYLNNHATKGINEREIFKMKLLKKEAQIIADNYKLGKVKRVTYLSEGWVNYNFKFETDKGNFAIQILGTKFDIWKRKQMEMQFKVLNFLKKKNFPYEIPVPLKNKKRKYLMNYKKRKLWVYEYIEGKINKKLTKKQFQELARSIAIYHKFVTPLGDIGKRGFVDWDWIFEKYRNMRKKKPKNKLDKLVAENIDFFENILNQTIVIDYGKNIMTHSDFNDNNIIFKKGKLKGIIDFDNFRAGPRTRDIALALDRTNYLKTRWTRDKQKIFFKEYEKIIPLSKKEKNLILPILLLDHCILFWWFYECMEKNRNKAYESVSGTIKQTRRLLKEWKKIK